MAKSSQSDPVVVSTTGSTLNNGKRNAVDGYGGYFGPKNNCDGPQTNNRAELMAIYEALRRTPYHRNVIIRTDSDTSRNASKADVIKKINELVRRRTVIGSTTTYMWIRGHVGDVGNEAADKLAKQGAKAQKRQWYKTTSEAERDEIFKEELAKRRVRNMKRMIKKSLEDGNARLAKMRKDGEVRLATPSV
ncbi:hypothetical protein PSPO01_15273 [Paraphaeosphaeria sporulosa]